MKQIEAPLVIRKRRADHHQGFKRKVTSRLEIRRYKLEGIIVGQVLIGD